MYIQYETVKGEYYCLDLFENLLNMFLLSYSWIKPRKLYKSDKKYTLDISKEERERRNLLRPFIIPMGYILGKFIKFDLGISFEVDLIGQILLYIAIYLIDICIIYILFKSKRKRMEKKIRIDREESIIVHFYPKTKRTKLFVMILYPLLILYTMGFCFNILKNPTGDSIITSIFLLEIIVVLAFYNSLLLCEPHYHGHILKKSKK